MAQLKKLTRQRGTVKAQVTRIPNYFDQNQEMSAAAAEVRLKGLEECWSQFKIIQEEIEDLALDDGSEAATKFAEEQETERQQFEDKFYQLSTQARTVIEARQENRNRQDPQFNQGGPANHQNVNQDRIIIQERRNKLKLPHIPLTEFNGEFTKWLFFKNSFETTIHNDDDLSDMQKHQYLIAVLKGPAREVIEGFSINNNNYDNAWNLLKSTYDNEMIIIETHLEELLKIPGMNKDDRADSIRQIIWHIQTHISSLKTLHQPVDHWSTLIIHLVKKQLDFIEQRDWQNTIQDRTPQNMPTLNKFIAFLTQRCQMLRMLQQQNPKAPKEKPGTQREKKGDKKDDDKSFLTTQSSCRICSQEHQTWQCNELMNLTADEKKNVVMGKKLCINCLNPGHFARDCNGSSCKKCGQRHNTILHREKDNSSTITAHCTSSPIAGNSANVFFVKKTSTQVILSTALVSVYDANGNAITCRALLDPGSQVNFMTNELARRLQLPTIEENRSISGINQVKSATKKVVSVTLKSRENDFKANIECHIMSSITEQLPQTKIDVKKIVIPQEVRLADPQFHQPGRIEILIGAGLFWKSVIGKPRNQIEGQPALQNTQFGWIIGGKVQSTEPVAKTTATTFLSVSNAQLSHQLERFWKQETIQEMKYYTKEEKYCEEHFEETVRRDQSGRFSVKLPTRPNVVLGESKQQAQKRLESLERRLTRDPSLREAYQEFMNEYLELEHMTPIDDSKYLKSQETYYIPQQIVVRPESTSTKYRVVFDASAKTTHGTSLNDKLMPGPNLQQDLFKIVLKFRSHEYVITADVKQMYRQILVDPEDRCLQLILWRKNPAQPAETFELNTVTYGTACAPYHAMKCLRELASLYRDKYPLAALAVDQDFYMDDVLSGMKTLEKTKQLQQELTQLLMEGQFPLRKWRSNDPRILENLSQQSQPETLLILDKEEPMKTLGLFWNSAQDILQYLVNLPQGPVNTKRLVLSRISQIFDPLGLVSPILIKGKMMMQQLWFNQFEWDQPLPPECLAIWNEYYSSLSELNELRILRNVNPGNPHEKFEVAGFGDASKRAYGACLYVVSRDDRGIRNSRLLCSKSRVAPLKTLSLPRLELEAALLLSQLYNIVRIIFRDRIDQVSLWSDSTVVLGWIRTEPQRLKTFVANRVNKIQEMTEGIVWNHVPSEENPADILSRGTTVDNMKKNQLWWQGPGWLTEARPYPLHMELPVENLPETKSLSVSLVTMTTTHILQRSSSYSKLCRIIAYCQRFLHCRDPARESGQIKVHEIEKAEKIIVRWVQEEVFPHEIRCLKNHHELPKKSTMIPLKPFLDEHGLIRVGGRLQHAQITNEQKHPIILPPRHHITTIIMREEHQRLQHCPPEQLLHAVRDKFWPISGRKEAQKIVRRCLPCFRFRPTIPNVVMGDLPEERVRASIRPFTTTGVDYAGPLQIRESRRRGRVHITKGYVAVFTCFSTKAIHLELVTDLTTEAFVAALSRFTARRGLCPLLFSDNGTNFGGAARELQEIFTFLSNAETEIATALAKQQITWNFIPPRAPHFGGLWEAAVKSMKRHLNTVTQGKILTYEEYSTLLCGIEAVLNSRPLTPLTNDPADFNVLTPSHFLIGDSLVQPVQYNFSEIPDNRLSRWQHLQKLRQLLWTRWQKEYLQELQKRGKWNVSGTSIELNTLVLMMEDNVSPLKWAIGRVIELHPGTDGEVRVVTIKTTSGSFKRAVKKLCPLPMEKEENN